MTEKVISLAEAAELVQDNQVLAYGGMTNYRRPVAFSVSLIGRASPPRNLTLLAFTAGLASDMLVGAQIVTRTRSCYFGLATFGLAPMFTAAANNGRIDIVEESEASIANGLRAKMAGIGFIPSRSWLGTDMFMARPDVKTIIDPYSGEELTAFPAIRCDVAIIHVLRADYTGNCILGGNPTIDLELATIAKTVIITAEELVPIIDDLVDITAESVQAVVSLPQGAWPTSCYPLYPVDGHEILNYVAACKSGDFSRYIQAFDTNRSSTDSSKRSVR
jgi:glutaconate CoA-transferase subunit A